MNRRLSAVLLAATCLALACDKKESPAPDTQTTQKTSASVEMPKTAAAAAPQAGVVKLDVKKGKASFLIDAPLEKIKGATDDAQGHLDVVPADLNKTRGEISFRLTTLKTSTFNDKDKDDSQTEHARNWMEVGPESPADKKKLHDLTTLTITSVETATPKLADVKEENGVRTVKAKVTGDYLLHGVTASKTVMVTAMFKGPADAPTEVSIKSDEAFPVSMKEHQVMPRDKIGSFLNGALDKIGKKIDDKVQVSIEATAQKS